MDHRIYMDTNTAKHVLGYPKLLYVYVVTMSINYVDYGYNNYVLTPFPFGA